MPARSDKCAVHQAAASRAVPGIDGSLVLSGFMLRGPAGRVRLVVEPLCLDLDRSDVLWVEETELADDLPQGFAIPVRLCLRAGARLWGVCASEVYEELLPAGRTPFAIAARGQPLFISHSAQFRQLETDFLRARGIPTEP